MKRVLVIAYFFPPLAGSGVQRTLKFVKYLRRFNWEPVVITVNNSNFPIKDKTLYSDIPENLEVIRIDECNPYKDNIKNEIINLISNLVDTPKNINDIKNILGFPDKQVLWTYNVIKSIESKIDFNKIDLIYTTSGPYSSHIVGYTLKKNFKIPWVVDFRDEWTNNPYFNNSKFIKQFKIEKEMEENILNYSDKVITTTPVSEINYKNNFNIDESKIITITNGYDEEDFLYNRFNIKNKKFTIVYNGSLYLEIRPYTLLLAVNNLIKNGIIDKNKIVIKFIGTCAPKIYKSIIKQNIYRVVKFEYYLSHKKSLIYAQNADLLLLIIGKNEKVKSVYTGKVFEYLRLKKPILALSPKGSVVEELVNRTCTGKNIQFDDIFGIEKYIKEQYDKWLVGINNINVKTKEIIKYERKYLTRKLSEVFDEII